MEDASLGRLIPDRYVPALDRIKALVVKKQFFRSVKPVAINILGTTFLILWRQFEKSLG
jgi:hypothetical protein